MKTWDQALSHAKITNKTLTNEDFDKNSQVFWKHLDETTGDYNNAFCSSYYGWWIIYTKDKGYFVYHSNELIKLEEVNLDNKSVTVLVNKE